MDDSQSLNIARVYGEGRDEATIRAYIRNQEAEDQRLNQMKLNY